MTSLTLNAPAKVNLFLKVLEKRKDSYHSIETVFERISIADTITITKIPKGIRLSSDSRITGRPQDNLAYKAARLILEHKKAEGGVRIRIKKRIPIAAGLGGGSSDAATVLIGINRLYGLGIGKEKLSRLGRRLGADVPFFILEKPFALGKGIGERLTALRHKGRFWHLLVYPGFKVPTRQVYEAFDKKGGSKCLTTRRRGARIQLPRKFTLDLCTAEAMLYNDLERVVVAKYGAIRALIGRLATLIGKKAILSGSGPSVFCLCAERKEALEARRTLLRHVPAREKRRWRAFIAKTY
ncbi:MAG: 4-(cytidine 5'-diphospho)-2-C-methyl-D-erythritol kinase [Candidatus Omnitrophica bacterium]|nr:4-(cytidine 5'-diphospho)-2-C-methyl-D-erythritol kinase [Candidatus Omnitrophota bacterium]